MNIIFTMLTSINNSEGNFKDQTFAMIRILAKTKPGLRIVHINAQSLLKKIDEFRYLF